jgi:hypothetical protein
MQWRRWVVLMIDIWLVGWLDLGDLVLADYEGCFPIRIPWR